MSAPSVRLLYFAGKYFPGSMAVSLHADLLDALAEHGVVATIASLGPADQRAPVVVTVEEGRRVVRVASRLTPADRALNALSKPLLHYDFFLSGARRLATVMRGEPFDLVQGNMAFPFGAMAAAALDLTRRREPLLLNLAGGDLIDSAEARYGYARYPRVRATLRYAFRRAAVVRANSPVMAERALELGCPLDRLRVVPVNIAREVLPEGPLEAFRAERRARLRAAHGLPEGPILLAVGRLTPIKGFEYLVRALPAVTARWPGATLLLAGPTVAGEEGYADGLRGEAAQLGVGAELRLLGPLSLAGMRDLYAAADLLVVPSLFEGLNKAGIEAGANGTPCVITDSIGLADYVRPAGSGLLVPPRDPAALAEAITALLADPARWQAAAAAARRLADDFTPAAIARALLPHYAEMLPAGHAWAEWVRSSQFAVRSSLDAGPVTGGAR